MNPYRICTNCIMDTSDSEIRFDENGICNYCNAFDADVRKKLELAQAGKGMEVLSGILNEIKRKGRTREYDCIVGVSGGGDSTYAAYNAVKLGLKPLAVHFDSGWNSELAVNNIENIVKNLKIDLYTFVADWPEMQNLQLAYFKASVSNCDLAQDMGLQCFRRTQSEGDPPAFRNREVKALSELQFFQKIFLLSIRKKYPYRPNPGLFAL